MEARPLVFLAHPILEGGYHANLERARTIQAGAEETYFTLDFTRALGRTPDEGPNRGFPELPRVQEVARRMILGDAPLPDDDPLPPSEHGETFGPRLWGTGKTTRRRAQELWVVGPITKAVEEQLTWATEAGIDTLVFSSEEQEVLVERGRVTRDCELDAAVEKRVEADKADFRGPADVLRTFFGGAESILGARALPIARLGRCGGNPYGRKQMIELTGIRIAAANGIIERCREHPKWNDQVETVLRVLVYERGTLKEAALAAGLEPCRGPKGYEWAGRRVRDVGWRVVRECLVGKAEVVA